MCVPQELLNEIRKNAHSYTPSPYVKMLMDEIRRRHGSGVRAIIYYGSCLQSGREFDSLLDLYVLVDDYLCVYKNLLLSLVNWLLPPNVFYLELPTDSGLTIRAKYAVVSTWDFRTRTSNRAFHSYFWARFCQPVAIIFYSDNRIKKAVEEALACAVMTFHKQVIPCIPSSFTARQLWLSGLSLSYRAELRPERTDRLIRLWKSQGPVLEKFTMGATPHLPFHIDARKEGSVIEYVAHVSRKEQRRCRLSWKARSLQGKILSVLRLLKAALTFKGGVDYALWKIKRHTGIEMEVSPFLRRHPVLAMFVLSYTLLKKGIIK